MNAKEKWLLNLIRNTKKGYAKDFTFEDVLKKVMKIKGVTDYAEVDVAGIVYALEGLVKLGKLEKYTHKGIRSLSGEWEAKTEPHYIWNKITDVR